MYKELSISVTKIATQLTWKPQKQKQTKQGKKIKKNLANWTHWLELEVISVLLMIGI